MKSSFTISRVFQLVENEDEIDPVQAFQIRILLIHQYRRILLKDPNLPLNCAIWWLSLNAREFNNQSLSDCLSVQVKNLQIQDVRPKAQCL